MWITVDDCARWLGTSAEMVRILGLRGRFPVSVDAQGFITHVAVPQPEPPEPDEPDRPPEREEVGRLSIATEVGGEVSVAEDPEAKG